MALLPNPRPSGKCKCKRKVPRVPSPPPTRIVRDDDSLAKQFRNTSIMSDKLVDLQNLTHATSYIVSGIILPELNKNGYFRWNTTHTHFKTINIITTMLNNLNFKFEWEDENIVLITI